MRVCMEDFLQRASATAQQTHADADALERHAVQTNARLAEAVSHTATSAADVLDMLHARASSIKRAGSHAFADAAKAALNAAEEATVNVDTLNSMAALLTKTSTNKSSPNFPTLAFASASAHPTKVHTRFGAMPFVQADGSAELPDFARVFHEPPSLLESRCDMDDARTMRIRLVDASGRETGLHAKDVTVRVESLDVDTGALTTVPVPITISPIVTEVFDAPDWAGRLGQEFDASFNWLPEQFPSTTPLKISVSVGDSNMCTKYVNIQNDFESGDAMLHLPVANTGFQYQGTFPPQSLLFDMSDNCEWFAYSTKYDTYVYTAQYDAESRTFTYEDQIQLDLETVAPLLQRVLHTKVLQEHEEALCGLVNPDANNCLALTTLMHEDDETCTVRAHGFNRLTNNHAELFLMDLDAAKASGIRACALKDAMLVLLMSNNMRVEAYIHCVTDGRAATVMLDAEVPVAFPVHFSIYRTHVDDERIAVYVTVTLDGGVGTGVITESSFDVTPSALYTQTARTDRPDYAFQIAEDELLVLGDFNVYDVDGELWEDIRQEYEVRKFVSGRCTYRARTFEHSLNIYAAFYKGSDVFVLRYSDQIFAPEWVLERHHIV